MMGPDHWELSHTWSLSKELSHCVIEAGGTVEGDGKFKEGTTRVAVNDPIEK
jgi:hypothetical protein